MFLELEPETEHLIDRIVYTVLFTMYGAGIILSLVGICMTWHS